MSAIYVKSKEMEIKMNSIIQNKIEFVYKPRKWQANKIQKANVIETTGGRWRINR